MAHTAPAQAQDGAKKTVATAENGNTRIIAVVMNGSLKSWYEAHQQCRNKIIDSPVMCVKSRCNNKEYMNVDLLFLHIEGPCTKHLRYECWQRKLGAVARDSIRNCKTEQNSFGCEVSRQVLHDNPRQARPN